MKFVPSRRQYGLAKTGPAHPIDLFRRQVDRLFEDFFDDWPLGRWGAGAEFLPRLDITESDQEVVVKAELPGLEEKDINVSLSGGRLTISGEKKTERETKDRAQLIAERSYGSFSRTVDIGAAVDESRADASFKNGVLTVKVPKHESAKPKKIEIKT